MLIDINNLFSEGNS